MSPTDVVKTLLQCGHLRDWFPKQNQSINQSINPSFHQSINQSINHQSNQSIHHQSDQSNPSIHQSINPSIHQSINPSTHQSINPSIHQPINPSNHQYISLCISINLFNIYPSRLSSNLICWEHVDPGVLVWAREDEVE